MTFSSESGLVGRIARLFVHPVKSCAGTEVQEAVLTEAGLELDRAWMVVDAQGVFLSQRTLPRMALVRPQAEGAGLVLRAPGMPALHLEDGLAQEPARVTVWKDTVPALDMGEAAARWLGTFLGQPCRLVRFDPAHRRLSSMHWTGGLEALNRFSDGFPVLVASDASLADLNQRLRAAGHAAVGMERFRPNVVLGGVEAFDEDRVESLRIATGDGQEAQLQLVKPCARCPIPDIDPATAESHPSVGDTLRTFRQDKRLDGAITFGMNAIVRQGAGQVLRVGQPVAAGLCFD